MRDRAGDAAIVACAEAAFESIRLGAEQPQQRLLLARIQSTAQSVEHPGLLHGPHQPALAPDLGFEDDPGEPHQPRRDVKRAVGGLESIVVRPAATKDGASAFSARARYGRCHPRTDG